MDHNTADTALHLVVDDGGANRQLFAALQQQGLQTVLLPASSDLTSLEQAVSAAANRTPLRSLHLYSHAAPGRLRLGSIEVDPAAMRSNPAPWQSIGQHLQPGGDVLIYGCNLARGESGRQWLHQFANISGVDVAASTNPSGFGGDWILEEHAGLIETNPPDLLTGLAWPGQLSIVNKPVSVPLHWVDLDSNNDGQRKLGIYASLGGSAEPQLFEFDSGGAGFYAAYGDAKTAPWWGPRVRNNGTSFEQSYDSGMTYRGTAVSSSVELFGNRSRRSSRLKVHNIVVGQTNHIDDQRHDRPATLWPESSEAITPPVSNSFYGDFGMAPKRGQHKIDSLAGQLRYGPGVTAGFRIHASAKKPWVQFGLGPKDLAITATSFRMNRAEDGKASPTGVPYFHTKLIKGSLLIEAGDGDAKRRFTIERTGFLLDTGASTSIHRDRQTEIPADLTQNGEGKALATGVTVTALSPSLDPARHGKQAAVLQVQAGTKDKPPGFTTKVAIKDIGTVAVNTGIRPFLTHDVVVNLKAGQLTLLPRADSHQR